MKYKRMLCWVRPHEKKELKEAVNDQFPIVFAKNYEDFKKNITPDSYLIFSATRSRYLNKLKDLVRMFPNCTFFIYGQGANEESEDNAWFIQQEPNVTNGQYVAKDFLANFINEIPDLWKWTLSRLPNQNLRYRVSDNGACEESSIKTMDDAENLLSHWNDELSTLIKKISDEYKK